MLSIHEAPGSVPGISTWRYLVSGASLIAQSVKSQTAMQETPVRSQSQEDPLKEEMASHSSILAGESHGQRSLAGYSQSIGSQESDMT